MIVAENKLIFEYWVHLYLHNRSVIEEQTTGHEILCLAWLHDLCLISEQLFHYSPLTLNAQRHNEFNKQTCKTIHRQEMIAGRAAPGIRETQERAGIIILLLALTWSRERNKEFLGRARI